MAGIYIHIPFCKTKCHYCDFYKSTDFGARTDFLSAMKKEMILRKHEVNNETIESIYFGGGTPSLLKVNEIESILEFLYSSFQVHPYPEITLEANPDDLNGSFVQKLAGTRINRLSIGIQSFNDRDLKAMNRRHNAVQAIDCIKNAQVAGFGNLSIDLIYGLPNQSLEDWEKNVEIALFMNVSHISAYHLTYHKGTVFYDYLKSGKISEIPDEVSLAQFRLLKHRLEQAGYEHYEISNFARDGQYSKHNRSYWERKNYIGFGPSAHSFDQRTRRWNVSSLKKYLKAVENETDFWEEEVLSPQDQYNDYMITSLRTMWGISSEYLDSAFDSRYASYFRKEAQSFIETGHMFYNGQTYTLSEEGLFISDGIMEKLFFTG
jgi:oxygen-independent coproporphyrinogen-3 oxidase